LTAQVAKAAALRAVDFGRSIGHGAKPGQQNLYEGCC
jgi:hypothetical protein